MPFIIAHESDCSLVMDGPTMQHRTTYSGPSLPDGTMPPLHTISNVCTCGGLTIDMLEAAPAIEKILEVAIRKVVRNYRVGV